MGHKDSDQQVAFANKHVDSKMRGLADRLRTIADEIDWTVENAENGRRAEKFAEVFHDINYQIANADPSRIVYLAGRADLAVVTGEYTL